MKSLFLNKTKKYISSLLVFVFALSLFFSSINVKTAEGTLAQLAPQVVLNTTSAEIGFINAGMLTDQTVATADQVEQNWWQIAVKYVGDKLYQIQDAIFQKSDFTKEYILDPLFWTMANVIIDQFGDAIVDWIRNGFDGSPMFLSDPEGFFRDTANQVSGAIIDDLNMGWLCDPLGKLRLNIDFFFPGTNRVKYECTFNDIAANFENIAERDDISDWISFNAGFHEKNIVTTFGNDYRNGGFLMWLFTAQKKNNDLGRTIQTASDIYIAASVSVGSEKFNLNLNQGFFGVRKCVEWQETYDIEAFAGASGSVSERKCLKYETQTPGQLVQDQLKDVGGKDLSRLQVADEIDEIIGALATTMMGWILTGGADSEGQPIGVLGYDKNNKDYAGSQRDHYGKLKESQQMTTKKSNISGQIVSIKSNEEQYGNSLENYAESLFGTKEKLEIVLAKLKCIRATSTNDITNTYDESVDCDGASEDTKNISLSAVGKTVSEISSDISKTDEKISDIDSKISIFTGKYGENATSTSAKALELFDEFEDKVMSAVNLDEEEDEIENLKGEYCYSYDKINDTGEICGLFGDSEISETYKTHSQKDFEALNKEAGKIEGKEGSVEIEYSCILDEYTQSEDVSEQECASSLFFKGIKPSSSSSEEADLSSSE